LAGTTLMGFADEYVDYPLPHGSGNREAQPVTKIGDLRMGERMPSLSNVQTPD